MIKDFCTYEQSVALKELGFDEDCIAYYDTDGLQISSHYWYPGNKNSSFPTPELTNNPKISAPLKSAVFRWFEEIHGLYKDLHPEFYIDGVNINWRILWPFDNEKRIMDSKNFPRYSGTMMYGDNGEYKTQDDAESACIDKLIELIKNNIKQSIA
jgi:hypothetical protein